jgi:hypothetical protein
VARPRDHATHLRILDNRPDRGARQARRDASGIEALLDAQETPSAESAAIVARLERIAEGVEGVQEVVDGSKSLSVSAAGQSETSLATGSDGRRLEFCRIRRS